MTPNGAYFAQLASPMPNFNLRNAAVAGLPPNARLQRLYPAAERGAHDGLVEGAADGTARVPSAPLSVQVFLVAR
jgi:hypothetical protein